MKTNLGPDIVILRRISRHFWAYGILAPIILFSGCASEEESHVVSAPPPATPVAAPQGPTTVTTQMTSVTGPSGQPAPAVSTVVVQAPPVHTVDPVLARPSPDYIWVPGHWTWRDSQYEWMTGHWEIPPSTNSIWIQPRWEPESGGYRFYEGYWN